MLLKVNDRYCLPTMLLDASGNLGNGGYQLPAITPLSLPASGAESDPTVSPKPAAGSINSTVEHTRLVLRPG